VLEPGDKALPHRHTAVAIRFSTRAENRADAYVQDCKMQ
jgi:gentisate 1,2-dioxygenase